MMNNFMRNLNLMSCNGNCEDCPETDKWVRMDEAERRRHIAMLNNRDMMNLLHHNFPEERIALLLGRNGNGVFTTEKGCIEFFGEEYDEMEIGFFYDERLILRYNPEEVVKLDGVLYLTGAAEVLNMDEHGNECSIGLTEVANEMDFVDMNSTQIEVDGKTIPALRLE